MHWYFLAAVLATEASASPPGWEKVHTIESSGGELAAVTAWNDGRWLAAGGDVIVRGGPSGTASLKQPGRFIVGLGGAGEDLLLAVGGDDLILRLDGNTWVQESFVPDAAKLSRMRRRQLLLQGAVHPWGEPLVAYGPWRVLVRKPDGKWQAPDEKERYRLMMLAQMGPPALRPKGCNRLQWRWLADGHGWLTCESGRTFLIGPDGVSVEGGRLPRRCGDSLGAVVLRGGSLVAACADGEIWQSGGKLWDRIPSPKVDAIAVGGRCLFGVSSKLVWRNCSLP